MHKPEGRIRLITAGDVDEFFSLIERNRGRLYEFFPVTTGAVYDTASAAQYIGEKLLGAQEGRGFLFVAGVAGRSTLGGAFFIRNIDRPNAKAELAYFVDTSEQNRGLGTSGLSHLIRYCFSELNLNKVYLRIAPDNRASCRVAEKNGFAIEGVLRSDFRVSDGTLIDVLYYGLLKVSGHGNQKPGAGEM